MAPVIQNSLSPAELAFLHSSLLLTPPVRPDARTATQFRPLVAESNILPGTNGSARICFADGTEAIVGIKAEVEKSRTLATKLDPSDSIKIPDEISSKVYAGWVELKIEIPGQRDDESLSVFLSALLHESLVAGGELAQRLFINPSWHWKLYIDILLLSPPLSYPVPLLSLAAHLALLNTRLPALKSEQDEDPFFDDDWNSSKFVYPLSESTRPSVTLLVASVGPNILFDPCREEIAVADALLAVSLSRGSAIDENDDAKNNLRLLSIRTIDTPSRVTPTGVPDSANAQAVTSSAGRSYSSTFNTVEQATLTEDVEGLWRPCRGGMSRLLISNVIGASLTVGGVGDEVLTALQAVEGG